MTRIYTKTGDHGETGLVGGQRVSKASLRVQAYGTVDELNAWLGLVLNEVEALEAKEILTSLQRDLFKLGADLAAPRGGGMAVVEQDVERLERWIDQFDAGLPPLRHFILPGGTPGAALLHLARSVCRRAEREVVALKATESVNPAVIRYLNRLSDLLFVLARTVNHRAGVMETEWEGKGG